MDKGSNKKHAAAAPAAPGSPTRQVVREALDAVLTGRMTEVDYNNLAWQSHQSDLQPCDVCGRTFNAKALARHQNACKPGGLFDKPVTGDSEVAKELQRKRKLAQAEAKAAADKAKSEASSNNSLDGPATERSPSKKPVKTSNMLLCPYCGREYGSQSLPIHIKTCQTKQHDVKVSSEVVEKVLKGTMSKEEVVFKPIRTMAMSANRKRSTMKLPLRRTRQR